MEFEKTILIFEMIVLEFALVLSLVQKQKSLNPGPKMPYLSIFGLEFGNNIVTFEISCLFTRFRKKKKKHA